MVDKRKKQFSFNFLQAVLITSDCTKYISNKTLTQENTFLGKKKKKASLLSMKKKMCFKNLITVLKSYKKYLKNLVDLIFWMIAKEQLACNWNLHLCTCPQLHSLYLQLLIFKSTSAPSCGTLQLLFFSTSHTSLVWTH